MSLKTYLRELRTERGLSMRDVDKLHGVSSTHLSQVERGIRRPGPGTLKKLAQAYNVPYDDLLRRAGHLPDSMTDAEKAELYELARRIQEQVEELTRKINSLGSKIVE